MKDVCILSKNSVDCWTRIVRALRISGTMVQTLFFVALSFCPGCGHFGLFTNHIVPGAKQNLTSLIPNPAQIPEQDPEFLWNQIVDTVDDYFVVDVEQRVQKNGQAWLDGKLTTIPQIGATYLEPWRKDARSGFQRLQSSLQTIRRTAIIGIIPEATGYKISVEVKKDLEDVDRSQYSSEGSTSVRHDGAVVRTDQGLIGPPITLGWIPIERDSELEQVILREIVGRVTHVTPPRRRLLHH